MTMDVLGFAYAAVIAIGGVIGYIKAGSIMSLVAGLGFGTLAAIGARQFSDNSSNYQTLLVVSCILAVLMGLRYSNTGRFMPAGLVALLSILNAGRLIWTKIIMV